MPVQNFISIRSWCRLLCSVHTKRGKSLCKTTSQYRVIHTLHSPNVALIQITREARISAYLLNVTNTIQTYINLTQAPCLLLDPPVAPSSLSLLYQCPVTSSPLKLVTSFSPWKDVGRDILKEIPFTELQGKLQCPQKPSTNFSHESNTSNQKLPFHSINTDFSIIFNSVWGSIISKVTKICAGRSGVQISAGARGLAILQNIQTSSSANPASKSSFFSGSKEAQMDSLTTHIHLEPSLKISGAIPPLNLSLSMAHSGSALFYLNHLPMYISAKSSHPL